jgi:MFS family permease
LFVIVFLGLLWMSMRGIIKPLEREKDLHVGSGHWDERLREHQDGRAVETPWIMGVFIVVGALLGAVVGFGVGVALGPGPEAGPMHGLEQFASGFVGGFLGLLIGPILGGAFGWAFKERREREQHRTPSSLPPGEHSRGT